MAFTALVVDDDPNWRDLEKKALLSTGLFDEIYTASDSWGAISKLFMDDPDMVFCDLHMGGHDGDELLEDIIEQNREIPFIVTSGTMANRAKVSIAEGIPSAAFMSKEAFLDPESIRPIIEEIYLTPEKHKHSPAYLDALKEAKGHIRNIDDAMVEANRIKGRVFALMNHYKMKLHPDDFETLKEFNYCASTPEETMVHLHDVKNMLSGMAHNTYAEDQELRTGFLRIADDVVQVLNAPRESSMNLKELVARSVSNLERIYPAELEISIPSNIRVNHPRLYTRAVYSLVENALQAVSESREGKVNIAYDDEMGLLTVSNPGEIPTDILFNTGEPYQDIESTRPFGSGKGIGYVSRNMEEIGQSLTYFNHAGMVHANLSLDATVKDVSSTKVSGKKPKVLFLDYSNGTRLTGMEETIELLDGRFGYTWNSDLNNNPERILDLPLEEYFLIVMHPEMLNPERRTEMMVLFSQEVLERMPYARYIFTTGVTASQWEESLPIRYDAYRGHNEENPLPDPKRGGIMQYVDETTERLPSSDGLRTMIQTSYLKFRAQKQEN